MNPKLFFSLITWVGSSWFTIAQNTLESFVMKSYVVEYYITASTSQSAHPVYEKTIAINGTPLQGHTIERAVLYFTSDNRYELNKPSYNSTRKEATAWYPMTEFESYYNSLKHKKGRVKISFFDSQRLQQKQLYITTNGLAPLKD